MAFKGKNVVKAKGGGKAKGKGSGTWAWIPDAAPVVAPWRKVAKGSSKGKGKGKVKNWMSTPVLRSQVLRTPLKKGKGKGKGKVLVKGSSKGKGKVLVKSKGKGKGKAKGKAAKPVDKFLERLHEIDASLKVWVGGLDEKTNFKKLTQHFSDVGKAKVALMPKGKACLAFKTTEEAESAIATLNGSELGGQTIEVDVWTQKEKKVRDPADKKKKKLVKTGFAAKVAAKNKANAKVSKFAEQLKALDSSLKVFVGKIPDEVSIHKLKKHFEDMGSKCAVADMMKRKGTACVGFTNADEAETAIGAVDGTELAGKLLEVSTWGKKAKEN